MGRHDKTELILNGSISKALVTLSIPIMINSLIQTLFNLVDGIWVSKISSVHFAATAFVWPINFLFISLGIGVSIAGTSLLSQLVGGGKIKEAKEKASKPIVTKASDFNELDDYGRHVFALEDMCTDVYSLASPVIFPCGREKTNGITII